MLTTAQLATLKAAILADGTLNTFPDNDDGHYAIAALLAQPSSPAVSVWRTNAPVKDVLDAIDWSKYTPVDVADGTGLHQERLLLIQTKQMNLQNMLIGRDTIDASKANIRAGLRDAVIQLPAGALGAAVAAGGASGATVLAACTRTANRGEAILAGADATTGSTTAKLLGFEGTLSPQDVQQARNS